MDVPFGLADTVNPMRASSVRHFFGTLPNGGTAVLGDSGLNLFVMGVRGGARPEPPVTPARRTTVPNEWNKNVVDANGRFGPGSVGTLLPGRSILQGSASCRDSPIVHFGPCRESSAAFDDYGRPVADGHTLEGNSHALRTNGPAPPTQACRNLKPAGSRVSASG